MARYALKVLAMSVLLYPCLPSVGFAAGDCPFDLVGGDSVKIEYQGFHGFIRVLVPAEESPAEGFPIIFYYHGWNTGLEPNLRIMRSVSGDRQYILVGMNYRSRRFYDQLDRRNIDNEIRHFRDVLAGVSSCIKVNENAIFVAGYSQGGYATTLIGEELLGSIAGMIILGSGRRLGKERLPQPEAIAGLPIFIGAGENDVPHFATAETTALLYALLGATVSMEKWPDTDHIQGWSWYQEDPGRAQGLRDWIDRVSQRADANTGSSTGN